MCLLSNRSLVSFINSPIRITNLSQSLIDHMLIRNTKLNCFKAAVFDIGRTDNCFLGLKCHIKIKNKRKIAGVTETPSKDKFNINYDTLERETPRC